MIEATDNKAATPEEVEKWIEHFRDYCEAQRIDIEKELEAGHKEFVALERAYWMGIVVGRGAEAIPPGLQMILFAYRSPLLEYKSPAKKRIRRTKAELEAAAAAEARPAEIPEVIRDQQA